MALTVMQRDILMPGYRGLARALIKGDISRDNVDHRLKIFVRKLNDRGDLVTEHDVFSGFEDVYQSLHGEMG